MPTAHDVSTSSACKGLKMRETPGPHAIVGGRDRGVKQAILALQLASCRRCAAHPRRFSVVFLALAYSRHQMDRPVVGGMRTARGRAGCRLAPAGRPAALAARR